VTGRNERLPISLSGWHRRSVLQISLKPCDFKSILPVPLACRFSDDDYDIQNEARIRRQAMTIKKWCSFFDNLPGDGRFRAEQGRPGQDQGLFLRQARPAAPDRRAGFEIWVEGWSRTPKSASA